MSTIKLNQGSRSNSSLNSAKPTTRSSVSSITTIQRKLIKKDFSKFYVELCKAQHSQPLQQMKHDLQRGVVDIYGDRIKFNEWYPIVTALHTDETLHKVCIRLRHRVSTPILEADTDLKARNVTKYPAITTKFVFYWLLESIKNCLCQSSSLTVLELEGLPLSGDFLALLVEGLLETKCLQHLSLSKCAIRDEGVEVVCMTLRNIGCVNSLDLSFCELTQVGAMLLAKLISVQKLKRYSEAWTQTLRYRDPDLETMQGLRRVSLNHNPGIGDVGIQHLVDEIRDDLWLRALDVQNTGITETGALYLVQLVRDNPHIVVLDARENPEVPDSCLSQIRNLLDINNADKNESEYKWKALNMTENSARSTTEKKVSRMNLRPWSSIPQGKIRGAPVSSYVRSQSSLSKTDVLPIWRAQTDSIMRENESLRKQLAILNDILGREARFKSDLIREMQMLKQDFEKCKLEKKQIEKELAMKPSLNEETLNVLEETLSKLAVMCSNLGQGDGEISDIPALLRNMRAVIRQSEVNGFELGYQDPKSKKLWTKRLIEQTINEDAEPPAHFEMIENTYSLNAQAVFSKMLKSKMQRATKVQKYNKIWNGASSSSSEEESS